MLDKILGVLVFVFADDIAIIADSRTRLNEAIDTILNWCKSNYMELNKNKSYIMYISKKKKKCKNSKVNVK